MLIVGASTRAAAYSAVRAGFQPFCVDQYGDQDLSVIANVLPKTDDDSYWLKALSEYPSRNWIYTGALENQPDLIDQISQNHRLNGCDGEILKSARNPFFLEEILSQTPIQVPACLPSGTLDCENVLSRNEKWLNKPLRGSAGHGIRFADPASVDFRIDKTCFLQRFQPGVPISVLFISFREISVLVGISRQFIGEAVFNADSFQFCGGMTLHPVPSQLRGLLEELGQIIAEKCQIQGIFGCDLILDTVDQNRIWFNEVNPRYTALTELFELQYQLPLLAWHFEACHTFETNFPDAQAAQKLQKLLIQGENQSFTQIAKGILYADQDILCPEIDWIRQIASDSYQIPEIADIPCPGTVINSGAPLCTVYGAGINHAACLQSLSERIVAARQLYQSASCQPESNRDVFNKLSASMELEKLFFSSFFSSRNDSHSFLED